MTDCLPPILICILSDHVSFNYLSQVTALIPFVISVEVPPSPVKGQTSEHLSSNPILPYFKVNLGDQVRSWASHKVCMQCVESLRMWTKEKRDKLAFGIPVIWPIPRDHYTDCYFCLEKTSGYNKKNKY